MAPEMVFAQLLAAAGGGFAPAEPPPEPPPAVCPEGMRLVEGVHYDQIQRLCTDYRIGHCYAFSEGLVAREARVTPIRACMDQYEWPNRVGAKPAVMLRFVEAEVKCRSVGKRLCTELEWETACEGPSASPWPYGFRQSDKACNTSKPYMPISEAKLTSREREVREKETRRVWQGEPSGSYPACVSSYGVVDLVGNVEEWVATSRPEWAFRSSLKGGYWSKPWAGCRGTNDSHGPLFRFYEVGFRCCKDPEAASPPATQAR